MSNNNRLCYRPRICNCIAATPPRDLPKLDLYDQARAVLNEERILAENCRRLVLGVDRLGDGYKHALLTIGIAHPIPESLRYVPYIDTRFRATNQFPIVPVGDGVGAGRSYESFARSAEPEPFKVFTP